MKKKHKIIIITLIILTLTLLIFNPATIFLYNVMNKHGLKISDSELFTEFRYEKIYVSDTKEGVYSISEKDSQAKIMEFFETSKGKKVKDSEIESVFENFTDKDSLIKVKILGVPVHDGYNSNKQYKYYYEYATTKLLILKGENHDYLYAYSESHINTNHYLRDEWKKYDKGFFEDAKEVLNQEKDPYLKLSDILELNDSKLFVYLNEDIHIDTPNENTRIANYHSLYLRLDNTYFEKALEISNPKINACYISDHINETIPEEKFFEDYFVIKNEKEIEKIIYLLQEEEIEVSRVDSDYVGDIVMINFINDKEYRESVLSIPLNPESTTCRVDNYNYEGEDYLGDAIYFNISADTKEELLALIFSDGK